jgi:hypothetical protein
VAIDLPVATPIPSDRAVPWWPTPARPKREPSAIAIGGIRRYARVMPPEKTDRPSVTPQKPAGRAAQERAADGRDRCLPPTPAARRASVEETAGALTGVYAPDELASLRKDWPA